MANMFSNLITGNNPYPARSEKSLLWFKDQASRIRGLDPQRVIVGAKENARARVLTGQLYLFSYEPKHKDKLPYYDRFPLVFPFKKLDNGFLGVNLHYLPLQLRAKLMDGLFDLVNNDSYDETTRLRISYNILSRLSTLRYFKPCVKHYLNNQMNSRFIYIPPEEWQVAIFLPIHRFKNANASVVHKDSRNQILGQ